VFAPVGVLLFEIDDFGPDIATADFGAHCLGASLQALPKKSKLCTGGVACAFNHSTDDHFQTVHYAAPRRTGFGVTIRLAMKARASSIR
jgi:hypothetical protein